MTCPLSDESGIYPWGKVKAMGLGTGWWLVDRGWWLVVGTRRSNSHRLIGKIYLTLMSLTAVAAFFIPSFTSFSIGAGPIRLGLIHLFIPLTINGVWQTRKALRRGDIAAHKASIRGLYFGGLLIAGALTFLPGRIMRRMFFG